MKATLNRSLLALFSIMCFMSSVNSHAEAPVDTYLEPTEKKGVFTPNYSFFNTSVNYLDWSDGTIDRLNGSKSDFVYLELEGGAGYDWGDAYFFADIENPTKGYGKNAPDNTRFVIKPIVDINIANSPWAVHIQNYWLKEENFYVNNLVIGVSYKYTRGNFWIRPFIGPHYQWQSFYDGMNGYMTGWVFGYNFKVGGQDFMLSQWHEYEFDRAEESYLNDDGSIDPYGDGASSGTNGALAIWWHINKRFTVGYQYRYADNKLGGGGVYQNANIFSVKYNF